MCVPIDITPHSFNPAHTDVLREDSCLQCPVSAHTQEWEAKRRNKPNWNSPLSRDSCRGHRAAVMPMCARRRGMLPHSNNYVSEHVCLCVIACT